MTSSAPSQVIRQAGGLVLHLGPQPRSFPLTPVSGTTFSDQPSGENAFGPSAVVFAVGADGNATGLRIDNLDGSGQGTFRRA